MRPMMTKGARMNRIEIKLASDDIDAKTGEFSGYGAVFGNIDSYGDVIEKGAFKASLREWEDRGKYPPMLLQHGGGFMGNADDMLPVGQWTAMEENSRGLKVTGRLFAMGTERGQYLYEGMKSGALDGLSIGYRAKKYVLGTKPDQPRRKLTDVDLVEVSIVTFPANGKARVSAVKSADLTADEMRDLEATLRTRGLSRADAVKAVSGFREYLQRDAGEPGTDLRDEGAAALAEHIRRNIATLSG
jgi:HK97 family phage prohead protease